MERLPNALVHYFEKYHPVSVQAIQAIADISAPVFIKKNETLQPVGRTCKTIYFIKKGSARIHYYKDGVDITEYFAFENNLVIRVESLFSNKPSRKAIEVMEDSEIIAIDAPRLFALYDVFPEIERLFRKIFEDGYVETVNRVESIQFHPAKERYAALLHQAPNILQRVPLKYIASYLGITQVSLSRIRAALII
ncbi:MAG: Crp/Fnr family transcriptional regulator [Saprospiraceae bacterium]|nr:Crp/Fnr family transcriptional regulator [Saprospiraceae bacterium]